MTQRQARYRAGALPTTISVRLPWPPQPLWPNRSSGKHWSAKNNAKKAAIDEGYYAAYGKQIGGEKFILTVNVYPPDRRRRDLDNIYAAMKPYQDGICKALGIDDSQIRQVVLNMCNKLEGGEVEYILLRLEE